MKPIDLDNLFHAEDFLNMDWENDLPVRESAAREANARFREIVKEHGIKVWNHVVNKHLSEDWTENEYDDATHEGVLFVTRELI